MKPGIVKGTRDFSPKVVYRRQYIFNILKEKFQRFGYMPIETPAMELLQTLTGKYGDEGDQLLFKILNNGDYLKDVPQNILQEGTSPQITNKIAKRGLRYDLTVPFARYVVMHQNEINFPFKRYQIQPVWRGDRPSHGRYREFYQCDVDVIGSDALLYEAELLQIYDQAFDALGVQVVLRLNNRKILEGLAHYSGYPQHFMAITVAIDKLDKIGWDGVKQELEKLDIHQEGFEKIKAVVESDSIETLTALFQDTPVGMKGIEELQEVLAFSKGYNFKNTLALDFSLARGLSYYTGCIFEVIVNTKVAGQEKVKMGSIGGGGRYDDLTGMFGLKGISGVGVSFGADRIYDVMEQLDLFKDQDTRLQLLFLPMDTAAVSTAFNWAGKTRQAGINTSVYPSAAKFKKQMKYANSSGVQFVGILGAKEIEMQQVSLKNMKTGDQQSLSIDEAIAFLKEHL